MEKQNKKSTHYSSSTNNDSEQKMKVSTYRQLVILVLVYSSGKNNISIWSVLMHKLDT